MKARIPKRVYTEQFRESAVRQVIDAERLERDPAAVFCADCVAERERGPRDE